MLTKPILRPQTRGELVEALNLGIKCEVVATNEEITTMLIKGQLNTPPFKTYPSDNIGWVVYDPDIYTYIILERALERACDIISDIKNLNCKTPVEWKQILLKDSKESL